MTDLASRFETEWESLSSLERAQKAGQWFADYIYGIEEDIPKDLPSLIYIRLDECFGSGLSRVEQFGQVRDAFIGLEYDQQLGMSLYFSGYPDDSFEMLVDNSDAFYSFLASRFSLPINEDSGTQEAERADSLKENTVVIMRNTETVRRREFLKNEELPVGNSMGGIAINSTLGRSIMESLADRDVDDETSWQEKALCAQTDPEAFFPEKGGSTREAKKVCINCEVRTDCLDEAIDRDERFGIWGGLSERERRKLKKKKGSSSPQEIVRSHEPFLKRPRRIEQLLNMMLTPTDELDGFFDHPELFARVVNTVIEGIYPLTDELDEELKQRRERLITYFISSKKEKEIHAIWDELTSDLSELSHEIIHELDNYAIDHEDLGISYAQFCLENWAPENTVMMVSSFIPKRPQWMKDQAESANTA